MKRSLSSLFIAFVSLCCICANCRKEDVVGDTNSQDKSPAGKIAGVFSGTGKKMPNGIFLGNYQGCVTPAGWDNNFITGNATARITKVDDNTINLTLTGGPFTNNTYSNIPVTESGGSIVWGSSYYDENSKLLNISYFNGSYISSNACLQGLPYYYGWSALSNGTYGYQTIGHLDFTGKKQ